MFSTLLNLPLTSISITRLVFRRGAQALSTQQAASRAEQTVGPSIRVSMDVLHDEIGFAKDNDRYGYPTKARLSSLHVLSRSKDTLQQ